MDFGLRIFGNFRFGIQFLRWKNNNLKGSWLRPWDGGLRPRVQALRFREFAVLV